jgi:tRNA 2-thiouridine synthesizing protein D
MTAISLSYSIILKDSPNINESFFQAYLFIQALTKKKHHVDRVFLYTDAVYAAFNSQIHPQDQKVAIDELIYLSALHKFPIQACIANSIRRGLLNKSESIRHKKGHTLLDKITLVGLGELVESSQKSDRIMTF